MSEDTVLLAIAESGRQQDTGSRVTPKARVRRALPGILGEGEPAPYRPLERREPLGFRLLGGSHLTGTGA